MQRIIDITAPDVIVVTGKLINGLVYESEDEALKRAKESFFDLQVSAVYVEVAE
jgi:hypothetical protein